MGTRISIYCIVLSIALSMGCSGASMKSAKHSTSGTSNPRELAFQSGGGNVKDEISSDSSREYRDQSAQRPMAEALPYASGQSNYYRPQPGGGYGGTGDYRDRNGKPYDMTYYQNYGENRFRSTDQQDSSTFGMDVDTASYTIARTYIRDGNMPDPDSVRTEEFINYFKHDYPEPDDGEIFSLNLEGAESGFGSENYHLMSIGVKARDAAPWQRPPANMIFVVDCSGSMARQDRLDQVKISLGMLAEKLLPGDRVGLVIYESSPRVISEPTHDHDKIMRAIDCLKPGGSTNAAGGLNLAYDMARRNFEPRKINRIILCSDGVANVGLTNADSILRQVRDDCQKGISLSTIGFGMGNYNDVLMEQLADHGDGMYFYVDTPQEAERVFGNGAVQMLIVLASDAKIQVKFNPEVVDRYRLIGYENRHLHEEDFRDNTVDAGEVGAGQTVTALYEISIRDNERLNSGAQLADVAIRYQNLKTKDIEECHKKVRVRDLNHRFQSATPSFRFTAAVAEYCEILRHDAWTRDRSLSEVLSVARDASSEMEDEQTRDFCDLVDATVRLEGSPNRSDLPQTWRNYR